MRTPNHPNIRRAGSGWVWAGIVLLLTLALSACGTTMTPQADQPLDYLYVAPVDIDTSDTQADIEAQHDGDIIAWHPDAGFAILGLYESSGNLATQATSSLNQDAIGVPEATASGVSAWAGGVSAWAGGVSAWAGGVSVWAGGVDNPFPGNETAWNQIQLGEAQELAPNLGSNVTVAVIDTGVDLEHVALTDRLTGEDSWRDFVDGDECPYDEDPNRRHAACKRPDGARGAYYGHGTAVAGIVLQAAPEAKILPIRVLRSDGVGDAADVVYALDHAIDQGVDVINLSLGTTEPIAAIDLMLGYAQLLGIEIVASSGNSGDSHVTYPAVLRFLDGYMNIVSVGSVDAADQKSSFSTYGDGLTLLAPGEGITTLYPNDQLALASGTSFAAPFAAGSLALAAGQVGVYAPTVDALLAGADDIDELNAKYQGDLGYGRLNAVTAIENALAAIVLDAEQIDPIYTYPIDGGLATY